MRILSFTPVGGTEILFPPAVEYSISSKRRSAMVSTARADGAYDQFGDTSPIDMQAITFPFQMICPTIAQEDALRLAMNKRGIIKAFQQDGTLRQTWFKCTNLEHPRSRAHRNYAEFTVEGMLYPYWRSVYNRSQTVSASPTVVNTRGNADVYDTLSIVFTATGSPTSLTLTNGANSYALTWNGSMTVGQTLTIDVPGMQVTKTGGVAQIGLIAYGAAAQIGLFKLGPGNNSITYSITGGGGSFAFSWRDTWY